MIERMREAATNVIGKAWRPVAAASLILGNQAAIPAPVSADPLDRPQPIVEQTPNFEAMLANLPPSAINVEKDPQKISALTSSMLSELYDFFPDAETRINALGYRISNAWVGLDNFRYISFQRAIIQKGTDNRLYLWNTLDNMSDFGMDAALDNGTFGVTIPSKRQFQDKATTLEGIFSERAALLSMPADVLDFAQQTRKALEIGVPTGYKNYGPYEVWRLQRLAIMKWNAGENKDAIQGILAGDAAKSAGLIPADVALAQPDIGSGGGENISLLLGENPLSRVIPIPGIETIKTPSGGSVSFLEHPDNPLNLEVDRQSIAYFADKYASGKDIQLILLPPNATTQLGKNGYGGLDISGGEEVTSDGSHIFVFKSILWDTSPFKIYLALNSNTLGVLNARRISVSASLSETSVSSIYMVGRGTSLGGRPPEIMNIYKSSNPPLLFGLK